MVIPKLAKCFFTYVNGAKKTGNIKSFNQHWLAYQNTQAKLILIAEKTNQIKSFHHRAPGQWWVCWGRQIWRFQVCVSGTQRKNKQMVMEAWMCFLSLMFSFSWFLISEILHLLDKWVLFQTQISEIEVISIWFTLSIHTENFIKP